MSSINESRNLDLATTMFYAGLVWAGLFALFVLVLPVVLVKIVFLLFQQHLAEHSLEITAVFYSAWAIAVIAISTLAYHRSIEKSVAPLKQLAQVGSVATLVAHDLKNPLFAANTILQGLLRHSGSDIIDFRNRLLLLQLSHKRLEGVTDDLFSFCKGEDEPFRWLDLHDLLNVCVAEFHTVDSGDRIVWCKQYADVPLYLYGRKNRIVRLVANLIRNGLDSIAKFPNWEPGDFLI